MSNFIVHVYRQTDIIKRVASAHGHEVVVECEAPGPYTGEVEVVPTMLPVSSEWKRSAPPRDAWYFVVATQEEADEICASIPR